MTRGRARLETVPLEAHAEAAPGAGRVDPLAILAEQEKTRLPELIRSAVRPHESHRHSPSCVGPPRSWQVISLPVSGRICRSSFAATPTWAISAGTTHPTRDLVFDLNDFDETLPGPFEWDVKRLAASVTVSARANGFTREQARRATRSAMRDYRKFIAETSERNPLDLHYYRFESQTRRWSVSGNTARNIASGKKRCWPRRPGATVCSRSRS